MTETPLDRAHLAMAAAPEDDAARLAFYDRLAEAELFVLLEAEPSGEAPVVPRVFAPADGADGADGAVVAAFDAPDRLTDFAGGPAPYAALSGRGLAAELANEGLGLALNLGAASEIVLPADAMAWLTATLALAPQALALRPDRLAPPRGLPEALLAALDAKLATARGLARAACLAEAGFDGGDRSPLLVFLDAMPGAEPALTRAVAEAVTFSGLDGGALDVAFATSGGAVAEALNRVGLRIELPAPEASAAPGSAPGMDPSRPPRLR